MAKIATDLEQSKKLAGILPIESADMIYRYDYNEHCHNTIPEIPKVTIWDDPTVKDLPAWSCSALVSILPHEVLFKGKSYKFKMCTDVYSNGEEYYDLGYQSVGYWLVYADSTDLVDACVEMIIKLKEKGLL